MTDTQKSNDCHFSPESIRAELERLQSAFGPGLASLHLEFNLHLGVLDIDFTAYHHVAGHSRPSRTIAEAIAHLGADQPGCILRAQAHHFRTEADRLETLAEKLDPTITRAPSAKAAASSPSPGGDGVNKSTSPSSHGTQ